MFHKTTILGHVGKEPEMRYMPNGTAITGFTVAVNEQFTNSQGEKVKRTIWYRVSTFGKQAETCNQYVRKGMLVLVEGRLTADPQTGGPKVWTKEDGTFGSSFELKADEVKFASRVENASGQPEQQQGDDLPF